VLAQIVFIVEAIVVGATAVVLLLDIMDNDITDDE